MIVTGGKKYYSVEEAATLAGVSVRTLRRWIADGRLSDFLYPFRASPNEVLYRLEAPDEDDVQNKKGEWVISQGGRSSKGGVSNEGISSS